MSVLRRKKKQKNENTEKKTILQRIQDSIKEGPKKKRKANRQILQITYIFVGMFLVLIGYIIYFVAVDSKDVDAALEALKEAGETAYVVGEIENGEKGVTVC